LEGRADGTDSQRAAPRFLVRARKSSEKQAMLNAKAARISRRRCTALFYLAHEVPMWALLCVASFTR